MIVDYIEKIARESLKDKIEMTLTKNELEELDKYFKHKSPFFQIEKEYNIDLMFYDRALMYKNKQILITES